MPPWPLDPPMVFLTLQLTYGDQKSIVTSSSSRVATSHFCHPLLHTSLRSVIVYQQVISCTRLRQEWAV